MSEEATKEWGQGIFKALKAKSAKSDDSPIVMGKIWSKINGGISTNADAIMDSGCTHPLTTMSVTNAIKMKVTPLSSELIIVEASGKNLRILGTVRMFLEADVLGGRKLIEAAVIQGEGSKEVLVLLGLMKSWDLIHQSFPSETVSDYMYRLNNKGFQAYSSLYSFQTQLFNESTPLKEPSRECKKLKAEITKEWQDCFKEKLGPQDRMKVPPVKLKIKNSGVKPNFCTRPYDTPYHL